MVKVENLARARDAQPPTSSRTPLIKSVIKRNYLEWEGRERMCIGIVLDTNRGEGGLREWIQRSNLVD